MGGVFAATCIKLVLQLLSFDFVIWGTPNENVVSHPENLIWEGAYYYYLLQSNDNNFNL